VNGEHKITRGHLDRKTLVDLRRSSMARVRDHTEKTPRVNYLTLNQETVYTYHCESS
jgi:hypothetical protein